MIQRSPWACGLAAALMLAGCNRPTGQALIEQRVAQMDPTQLWRAEALDDAGKVVDAIQVCLNRDVLAGFSRANTEINGQACAPHRDAVEQPGVYAVRCDLNGRTYGLTVNRTGDPEKAFTVRYALAALDGSGVTAKQTRRYTKVGACPAGWTVGDQGRGGAKGGNALAGTWGG
jgi:hypothetical protein